MYRDVSRRIAVIRLTLKPSAAFSHSQRFLFLTVASTTATESPFVMNGIVFQPLHRPFTEHTKNSKRRYSDTARGLYVGIDRRALILNSFEVKRVLISILLLLNRGFTAHAHGTTFASLSSTEAKDRNQILSRIFFFPALRNSKYGFSVSVILGKWGNMEILFPY